jgi:hypothetical protein
MSDLRLQYENKFAKSVDITDVEQNKADRYRTSVETRNRLKKKVIPDAPTIGFVPGAIKVGAQSSSSRPILNTTNASSSVFSSRADSNPSALLKRNATITKSIQQPYIAGEQVTSGSSTRPKSKRTLRRTTAVNINSADRDKVTYPDASDFKIFLRKSFHNVYKVCLTSTELTNTDDVIKDMPLAARNNIISWVNSEDADLKFPVYHANIKPGTYTAITLQNEMSIKMNAVKTRNGEGPVHVFNVGIDLDSNIVTFTRISRAQLPYNGFFFELGSTVVTVALPHHGFRVGDQVYITGVRSTTGTITAAMLNSNFTVTCVVDIDTFQFEVGTPSSTAAQGGGLSAFIGKTVPFKLLFGRQQGTIGNVIGFPAEDSSSALGNTDPLCPYVMVPTDVAIGHPTIFTVPDHGLKVGMSILIQGLRVLPDIAGESLQVYTIIDEHKFAIDVETTDIDRDSILVSTIATERIQINFPNHMFNELVNITQSPDNQQNVRCTTLLEHAMYTGDSVVLSQTNCFPTIDGKWTIINISANQFDVEVGALGAPLVVDGSFGVIGVSQSFLLYNSTAVGSISAQDINDRAFTVDSIIDKDNFTFKIPGVISTEGTRGGGENVSISSDIHGFSGSHSNTDSDGNLLRPLSLAGENYVFLCISGLGNIVNTGSVDNIFAKVLLNRPPGEILFNSYVPGPGAVFDDGPLPEITSLSISMRTHANAPFIFHGTDFSFTIEITELVDTFDDKTSID